MVMCIYFFYYIINVYINLLFEVFGNVILILVGNFGEVFSVVRI